VRVVADNPQTIDELCAYLMAAGVASNGTRELHDVSIVPPGATAVVLFPDDFQLKEMETTIASLRRGRPSLKIVLVTARPQHLRAALKHDGRSALPLVLPKPAFGWTILDAIRGSSDAVPAL